MKNRFYILILVILVCSCNTSSTDNHSQHSELKVQKEDSLIKPESILKSLMTSSSNIEPSKDVILDGISFTIVLNEMGDTTHWSTTDLKFKTLEGYNVGTNWDKIPIELKKSMGHMAGWGYFIKLNSGWQLGFCEGKS